jgi:hypothetical protein
MMFISGSWVCVFKVARLLLCAVVCLAILAGAFSSATYASTTTGPALTLVGEGTLRWMGMKVYDAKLFAEEIKSTQDLFEHAFALELTYALNLKGQKIAQRSLEEIKKLRWGTGQDHQGWLKQMVRIFPDVRSGDRIRGVYDPGKSVTFFLNDQLIGKVEDPRFAQGFFAIWLDPRTSEPKLRQKLLGAMVNVQ